MKPEIKLFIEPIRNSLLVDSDWTQLADTPLTEEKKAEWATYRQQLRDIPQNQDPEVIEAVVWPAKPE